MHLQFDHANARILYSNARNSREGIFSFLFLFARARERTICSTSAIIRLPVEYKVTNKKFLANSPPKNVNTFIHKISADS